MPDQTKVTIEIPTTLHRAAKIEAIKRGVTLRELLIAALKQQVAK